VLYELHVGTLYAGRHVARRIARDSILAGPSVTALQIMPLAAFSRSAQLGYDGVLHSRRRPVTGGTCDLKALIDGAHELGMMVCSTSFTTISDRKGTILHAYCSRVFQSCASYPVGRRHQFRRRGQPTVRDFFVAQRAVLDRGVFASMDCGWTPSTPCAIRRVPISVAEIAARFARAGSCGQVHLVLENTPIRRTISSAIRRKAVGRHRAMDDDFHHALHVLVSGESDGYFAACRRK